MTSYPPYVLPDAFLYDIAFTAVLALVLGLMALIPRFRRLYFAAVLVPAAFVESNIVAETGYSIPLELAPFGIPLVTFLSGIIVVVFYLLRRPLRNKIVKAVLVVSGLVELVVGVIFLLSLDVVGFPYGNGFLIVSLNYQFFFLGSTLSTVGAYSLVIGIFLLVTKVRKTELAQSMGVVKNP